MPDPRRAARWMCTGTLRKIYPVAVLLIAAAITITPAAQAQTLSLLHQFSGPDGYEPQGTLVLDRAGNLYGTTTDGGAGYGTVFKLSHEGSGWVLTTLYKFSGGADGASPMGPVIFGPDGTLYGMTSAGGAGDGIVFNLRPPAFVCRSISCPWTETVIHSFSGSDGRDPQYGGLIFDSAGNIYGATAAGGMHCSLGSAGCGLVFKLTKSNNVWTETVLYFFTGEDDGALPLGGVTLDSAGNLYGTTWMGGAHSAGTLFELSNTGADWTETTLHSFNASEDGGSPADAPVFDQQGNLYGTTTVGGGNGGTVFQLQPSGDGWTFNVIYRFGELGKPYDTPTLDAAGNLYGTTSEGGVNDTGNVFKLTPGTNGWTYTDLFDFSGDFSNGYAPIAGVTFDSSGNLYGATALGGNQACQDGGCGVVFELIP